MSVRNPGVRRSAPPRRINAPSVASFVGTSPRAIVSRRRRHVAVPSRFNNHAPATETAIKSARVSSTPIV